MPTANIEGNMATIEYIIESGTKKKHHKHINFLSIYISIHYAILILYRSIILRRDDN